MFKYNCLNPIAAVGLDLFSDQYDKVTFLFYPLQRWGDFVTGR